MKSDRRFFYGACDKCGETFEAQSKTDDLRGVKFKCRNGICSGKVSLDETSAESVKFVRSNSTDKGPRRFC